MVNIYVNYTSEVKNLYGQWGGCNMTCVDKASVEDLLSDQTYYSCDCDPYGKASESSTPFKDVTADVTFMADTTSADTSSSGSTTDTTSAGTTSGDASATAAKSSSSTLIIVSVLVVVVLVAFLIWNKNKNNSDEVHEEGGDLDNMFRRV